MNRRHLFFALIPALALVGFAGCEGAPDEGDEALFPPTKGDTEKAALKPVEANEFGTLAGTVTMDGDIPTMSEFPALRAHGDVNHCLKGPIHDQTWVVDAGSRGVANVVVWIEPPKDHFFPKPQKQTWQDVVAVDQPYCAFEPHVVVLYPQTYDPSVKKLTSTGQKVIVKNSAPILHNIRIGGRDNPSRGGNVQPGTQQAFEFRKDRQEISLNCDIHKWMTGYAMTFDHPYAAVTNEKGQFKIENVPAGSEITFMAWHEAKKKFVPVVAGGNKLTLSAGETKTLDFKISR